MLLAALDLRRKLYEQLDVFPGVAQLSKLALGGGRVDYVVEIRLLLVSDLLQVVDEPVPFLQAVLLQFAEFIDAACNLLVLDTFDHRAGQHRDGSPVDHLDEVVRIMREFTQRWSGI